MKQQLDFIVIGAQKSGTTTLFEYLRRHPELALPAAKEVPYFSHEANYARDWSEYLRKAFPFAEENLRWGTVTPHYMVGGLYDAPRDAGGESDERTVPLRIRRRLPDVRLVAIIRDPVERARSHHAMASMRGWEARPFEQAISELLAPPALLEARRRPDETTGYVVWGEYGRILQGYFDVFGAEQLLVLYTSELKDNPEGVLRHVFEFLGVAADFMPDNLGATYRPSATARRLSWLDLNSLQRAAAGSSFVRGMWHALPEAARRRVDRRFDRMNYRVELWNQRPSGASAERSEHQVLDALRDHYLEDTRRLIARLGAPPPWWRGADPPA